MDVALLLYRLSGWSQDIVWLIICWLAYKKYGYWKNHHLYFFAYILFVTIAELIYGVTALLLSNNLFLDYIYITAEFVLLGMYLGGIIRVSWIRNFVVFISCAFIIFQLLNAFWLQGIFNYNSYGATVNSLYLVALSIWSFTVLSTKYMRRNLFSYPESWFVLGILFIFLGVLLFDFLYGLAVPYKNDSLLYGIMISQNVFKTLCMLLFMKGISLIVYSK